jgi:hypothetical protein
MQVGANVQDFTVNEKLIDLFFDVHVTVHRLCILLGTTNKMQRFTIFFITVNALHVSGGFSAHHQELRNCTHGIWHLPHLLAATASVVGLKPVLRS